MTDPRLLFLLAAVIGAAGVWLLLPRGNTRGRALGATLGIVSLGIFAALLPGLGEWVGESLFWILAAVTIVSAAAAVTLSNPVYCAIWFGSSLLGTAGLFLFQGAQFLAVATVVVYAGAILVTFLFILMLAQPSGRARYDRTSWEGLLSTAISALMVGVLTMSITGTLASGRHAPLAEKITSQERQHVILSDRHVEQIGNALFGRYLVVVEAAATLLMAALVGAAVIIGHARGPLSGPRTSSIAEMSGDGGPNDVAPRWPASVAAISDRGNGGTTDGG